MHFSLTALFVFVFVLILFAFLYVITLAYYCTFGTNIVYNNNSVLDAFVCLVFIC